MSKIFRVIFLIGVLVVLFYAALLRWDSPADPYFSGDTWGYIRAAFLKLAGEDFSVSDGRNYSYPLLLYILLSLFGTVRAISSFQHVLGLVSIVLLALAWTELGKILFYQERSRGFRSILRSLVFVASGLALLWLVGVSTTVLFYEQYIGPEGVFLPASSLLIYLHSRFFRVTIENKQNPALLSGVIFCNFYLYFIRPFFVLASLTLSVLPILVSLRTLSWKKVTGTLAITMILFYALGLLPDSIARKNDTWRETFGTMVLFSFNAPVTSLALEKDLIARPDQPRAECKWKILDRLKAPLRAAKIHPASVNFGPWGVTNIYGDFFIYGDTFDSVTIGGTPGVPVAQECFRDAPKELASFYLKYSVLGIIAHPLSYLRKTVLDLHFYYAPDRNRFSRQDYKHPSFETESRNRIRAVPRDLLMRSAPGQKLLQAIDRPEPDLGATKYYEPSLEKILNSVYLPVNVLALALLFLELSIRVRGQTWSDGWWGVPICWITSQLAVLSINGCVALTSTLFIYRYIESEFVFSAIAVSTGIIAVYRSLEFVSLSTWRR